MKAVAQDLHQAASNDLVDAWGPAEILNTLHGLRTALTSLIHFQTIAKTQVPTLLYAARKLMLDLWSMVASHWSD